MRLKKLASGVALLGLSTGLGLAALAAAPAGAATQTIRPYIGFNPSAGIGQTDAGVWDNHACLIGAPGTGNNGNINGSPAPGHAGQLDVNYNEIVASPPAPSPIGPLVPVCVPVDINITGTASTVPGTKPGGTILVTTTSEVQGGIEAQSQVAINVTYSAGQTVPVPSGAALLSAAGSNTNPAGGTAEFLMKATSVKTKAVLNTSCSDDIEVIDTTTHDAAGVPMANAWDGSTLPSAGQYFATIRNCAEVNQNVAGKPAIAKIAVVGHGAVSAALVEAKTNNPATWSTTQGASCASVKTANTLDHSAPTFGTTALDQSRVVQCKGNYGSAIPFALDVRGFTTNGGQDPNGLQHPAAPLAIGGGTF